MDSTTSIFALLSFIVPLVLILLCDIQKQKRYSIKEFTTLYPIFIVAYIIARLLIMYDYYFVKIWAESFSQFSAYPQQLLLTSQAIVFLIDTAFWFSFSKTSLRKNDLSIAYPTIVTLAEGAFLMLVGMIVPWVALQIIEFVL